MNKNIITVSYSVGWISFVELWKITGTDQLLSAMAIVQRSNGLWLSGKF